MYERHSDSCCFCSLRKVVFNEVVCVFKLIRSTNIENDNDGVCVCRLCICIMCVLIGEIQQNIAEDLNEIVWYSRNFIRIQGIVKTRTQMMPFSMLETCKTFTMYDRK